MVLLSTGQYRVEYEDVLRALGNYLDAIAFRNVTIVETPDGFLTKGVKLETSATSTRLVPTTYLFTNEDIETVLDHAHSRRGATSEATGDHRPTGIRYEDSLRAIGRQVDEERLFDVAIVQLATGMHVKALSRPDQSARHDEHVVDFHIATNDLIQMVEDMVAGRASKRVNQTRRRWPF